MNLYRSSASVFEHDSALCFYWMAGSNGYGKCIFYCWPDPRMDVRNQYSAFKKAGGREKEYNIGTNEECECTQNPALL
jgi:hypothetical protein